MLWCHNDVIFEKSIKRQGLLPQIHVSIDWKSEIVLFLVHIICIAYFFLIWAKKAKYLKDNRKMRHNLSEKLTGWKALLMTPSSGKRSIILNKTFYVKRHMHVECFCKVSIKLNKKWRNGSNFKIGVFLAIFSNSRYSSEKILTEMTS